MLQDLEVLEVIRVRREKLVLKVLLDQLFMQFLKVVSSFGLVQQTQYHQDGIFVMETMELLIYKIDLL